MKLLKILMMTVLVPFGKIILRRNSNEDSTGYEAGKTITITTFTNHDANPMRKEVFQDSKRWKLYSQERL